MHIPLFIAPMVSIILLVLGSGVSTTLTTLVLNEQGINNTAIALVSSCFFVGVMLGSYFCQGFIFRVKHIRAYAALGTVCVAGIIIQSLYFSIYTWAVVRLSTGFCLAGLYIVIESWLLGLSVENNRGQILAIYMMSFYAAQASSQLILNIPQITPLVVFSLIAIFMALSVVPLAVTRYSPPAPEKPEIISLGFVFRRASLGVIGCIISGLMLSVIYSFIPKYIVQIGQPESVALVMFSIILGGTLLQFPIGRLSDIFDRRRVLMLICVACILVAIGIIMFHQYYMVLLGLCFLLGGSAFMIYPIAISHTIDFIESSRVLSAVAVLYIAYGIGSSIGPVLVVPFTRHFGSSGYFVYLALMSALLMGYCVYRVIRLPVVYRGIANQFVTMPSATFEGQQLDPRVQSQTQLEFDFSRN